MTEFIITYRKFNTKVDETIKIYACNANHALKTFKLKYGTGYKLIDID